MIIPVHMFAFADKGDRSKIRPVEIPIRPGQQNPISSQKELDSILEMVFKYGQNDFSPLTNFPSVSVGDIAEINGKYYMCASMGWEELSKEEFDSLIPPTALYAMEKSIKDAAKSPSEI